LGQTYRMKSSTIIFETAPQFNLEIGSAVAVHTAAQYVVSIQEIRTIATRAMTLVVTLNSPSLHR
jgi:hypothetical protein